MRTWYYRYHIGIYISIPVYYKGPTRTKYIYGQFIYTRRYDMGGDVFLMFFSSLSRSEQKPGFWFQIADLR